MDFYERMIVSSSDLSSQIGIFSLENIRLLVENHRRVVLEVWNSEIFLSLIFSHRLFHSQKCQDCPSSVAYLLCLQVPVGQVQWSPSLVGQLSRDGHLGVKGRSGIGTC